MLSKVSLFPTVTKCCSTHLVLVESASVVGSMSHAPCYLYVFKTMRIVSCLKKKKAELALSPLGKIGFQQRKGSEGRECKWL